jgi:hypothetical protein
MAYKVAEYPDGLLCEIYENRKDNVRVVIKASSDIEGDWEMARETARKVAADLNARTGGIA